MTIQFPYVKSTDNGVMLGKTYSGTAFGNLQNVRINLRMSSDMVGSSSKTLTPLLTLPG